MSDLFHDLAPASPVQIQDMAPATDTHMRRLVLELEHRIDKLSLICCAMWSVIQAHTNVGDEDLSRLVQELDLADGRLDGKAAEAQVSPCSACGRPVATRHLRCLYCGEPRRATHPFEGVL